VVRERFLSETEAKVLQAMLAGVASPGEGRFEAFHVPRSTFWSVRNKALRNGWLSEHYVPFPDPAGVRSVVFEVGRPISERRDDALRAWMARAGTVLLWQFRELLFSVVWETGDNVGATPTEGEDLSMSPPPLFHQVWTVRADPGAAGVPIYFDFEGAWARWSGSGKPISYPIPLVDPGIEPPGGGPSHGPIPPAREEGDAPTGSAVSVAAAGPSNPVEARPPADPGVRQVQLGRAQRRVFPDLSRIPSLEGRRIEQVIFVTGLLREAKPPRELLEVLLRDAEVAPFLVAFDPVRWMMALLSPRPPNVPKHGVPVTRALSEYLRDIDIERASLSALRPVLDHRYEMAGPR